MPKEIQKGYFPAHEGRKIERVFRTDNLITEPFRENLCGLTAPNMVGALVFALNAETFRTMYAASPLIPPRYVHFPFKIVDDLPLALKVQYGDVADAGIAAEKVLIKKVCGQTSGVVILGELSGLVLEEIEGIRATEALCVNQVWQDIPLQQEWPELPHFTIATVNEDDEITDPAGCLKAKRSMENVFNTLVRRTLTDLGYSIENETDVPVYPSDVFFRLCNQLGIPVDTDRFHRMRP